MGHQDRISRLILCSYGTDPLTEALENYDRISAEIAATHIAMADELQALIDHLSTPLAQAEGRDHG